MRLMDFIKTYIIGLLVIAMFVQPWYVAKWLDIYTPYYPVQSYFTAVIIEIAIISFAICPLLVGIWIIEGLSGE